MGRRFSGAYTVDDWGLDPDLVELLSPLFGLRYRIDVVGADAIPGAGPAVLVANRRLGLSEPVVLARGVRLATARHVRVLGVPDVAPVGPALRRGGGVLDRPDELAGLLRAGHVAGIFLSRQLARGRAGGLVPDALAPAVAAGAPVIPVAMVGREVGRRWRVVVGRPVAPSTVGEAVQALLDA